MEESHGPAANGLGRDIEGNRQCIQCPRSRRHHGFLCRRLLVGHAPWARALGTALYWQSGQEGGWMSDVARLHGAGKRGDLAGVRLLLDANRALANSRSETDARGTYPLHVAAEFGQADAARLLLDFR